MKLSGEAWLEYGVLLHTRCRTVGTICVCFISVVVGIFEADHFYIYQSAYS